MSINDYLIDHEAVDWGKVLTTWHWLLPREFTVWLMNRFGDLFIVFDDGTVHVLDVGAGTLEKVAESREDFREKIDQPGQANNWLMIPLVDSLVTAGLRPAAGECYSYRQLPVLGGDYTVENTVLKAIALHYAAFGPIHKRIKDLPDGTPVRFKIEP